MEQIQNDRVSLTVPGYDNVDVRVPRSWSKEQVQEFVNANFPPPRAPTDKNTQMRFSKADKPPAPTPKKEESPFVEKDAPLYQGDKFLWPLTSWDFWKDTGRLFKPRNLVGVTAKVGAGALRGVTLGIVDLEKGTVGVPFTQHKKQFQMPLEEALGQWGVDRDLAGNEWIGTAPDFAASMLPFGKLAKGAQWVSKVLRRGEEATKIGGAAGLGIRVAESSAAGAAEAVFRPRDEDESLLERFTLGAGLGAAGHLILAEGLSALVRKYSGWKTLRQLEESIQEWLYQEKGYSRREAQNLTKAHFREFVERNGGNIEAITERADETARAVNDNIGDAVTNPDFEPRPGGLAEAMQRAQKEGAVQNQVDEATSRWRKAWHREKPLEDMTHAEREAYWDAELKAGRDIPDSELAKHPALQKKYKIAPTSDAPYSDVEIEDFVADMVRLSDTGLYKNGLPIDDDGNILKVARRINLNRIQTVEDVKRFIMGVEFLDSAAMDRAGKGVIPHSITRTQAKQMIKQFSENTGVATKGLQELSNNLSGLNVKLASYKALLVASSEDATRAMNEALRAEATDQVEDAAVLWAKYQFSTQRFRTISQLYQSVTSEVGRGLNSLKIKMGASNIDLDKITPEMLRKHPELAEQFRRAFQKQGGKSKVIEMAEQWKKAKTLKAMTKVARGLDEHYIINSLVEGRKMNVLSSLFTHGRNIIGNVGRPIVESMEMYTQWALGKLPVIGGKGAIEFGEVMARQRAMAGTTLDFTVMKPVGGLMKGLQNAPNIPDSLKKYFGSRSMLDIAMDALELLPKMEKRIDGLGVDPFLIKEGESFKAISSDYLKDKFLFKWVSDLANLMDKGGRLDRAMWAAFDSAASALRMPSFSSLKLGDVPFEAIAYEQELAGSLYKLSRRIGQAGQGHEDFVDALYRQVKAYNAGEALSVTPADVAWVKNTQEYTTALADAAEALEKGTKTKWDVLFGTYQKLIKDLDDVAVKTSREWTWKGDRPGFLAKIESAMQSPGGKVAQLIPGVPLFVKTPVRLLEYTLKKTPGINLIFKETGVKALFSKDVNVRTAAWAKQFVGASIFGTVLALYEKGMLIGKIGVDERHVADAAGAKQYSMRAPLTNSYVNYAYIEPFGTAIGMTVDFLNFKKEHEHDPEFWYRLTGMKPEDGSAESAAGAFMMSMFHSLANNIAAKSWLKESGAAWEAINSTEKGSKRLTNFALTYSRSFMPLSGFFGSETKIMDDPYSERQETLSEVLAATYGTGRAALDIFGKELENYKPWLIGLAPSRLRVDSPIRVKMFQLGMTQGKPLQEFKGLRISNEDYDAVMKMMDTDFQLEDKLNRLVDRLDYLPAPVQQQAIRTLFNKAWTVSSIRYFKNKKVAKTEHDKKLVDAAISHAQKVGALETVRAHTEPPPLEREERVKPDMDFNKVFGDRAQFRSKPKGILEVD